MLQVGMMDLAWMWLLDLREPEPRRRAKGRRKTDRFLGTTTKLVNLLVVNFRLLRVV